MGQAKYFTLLRYADSTVMEVDLGTGIHHLVYAASSNFSALKSGDRFEDVLKNFAEKSAHPEDRESMLHFWDRIWNSFSMTV